MNGVQRVALELAYLGGGFAGWQRQPGARTVQGDLEAALAALYRTPVAVVGAGRTDAGVHAAGQVAHFDPPFAIPPSGIRSALNAALASDVRVLRARAVPAAFHARRGAAGKRYRYRLSWGAPLLPWEALRRASLPARPDVALMAAARHRPECRRGAARRARPAARRRPRGRRLPARDGPARRRRPPRGGSRRPTPRVVRGARLRVGHPPARAHGAGARPDARARVLR